MTNETVIKNLILTIGFKKKSTLDCAIKISSKLFLNQQEDVLGTFEILLTALLLSYLCLVDYLEALLILEL